MTTAVCPFLNFGFYLGLLDRDLGVTRKCCKGWFRWLNWTAKAVRHRPSYSRYFSFGHFMTRRPAMAQDKPGSSRTLDLHLSLLGDLELGLDAGFFLARPFERWATQPRFLHCLFLQICFQRRSTAIGLTQAGSALGVMVLPQFIVLGVEYFDGWHSVVRIIAGGCIITWYAG